ncbi:uncharacterized protein I206_102485 [Kwoniella pini CBS 10737]|uniref:Uncharacterized protein n=1 Tax=Kwoniella pini CBS 10737 TaxID=1296096 RepID=A0A1B9I5I2_9TREE|nr:uncharacterized protein I206_02836 [Kwoniella pini CBS 10737]OCF50780.1 hypothetical protein I206_02836 [Kwoniella pini CBS 10737]
MSSVALSLDVTVKKGVPIRTCSPLQSFYCSMARSKDTPTSLERNHRRSVKRTSSQNPRKLIGTGILVLILITFSLQLLISLSTGVITSLSLVHAESKGGRGDGIPRKISIGGSGGCMWFGNISGPPTKCIITTHFRPDPEILDLNKHDTIIQAMSFRMGIWEITNYISTALVFLGLIMFLITIRYREIWKITAVIFYFVTFVSWAALIGEIASLIILKKNVIVARPKFHLHPGVVIWLMIISTVLASITGCLVVWFLEDRNTPRQTEETEIGNPAGEGRGARED